MKRYLALFTASLLFLTGCNQAVSNNNETAVENEKRELDLKTEDKDPQVIENNAEAATVTMTDEELEALIEQKVAEKIAELGLEDIKEGVAGKDGADGKDGIGIADVVIDENGDLIIALTNGVVTNVGHVKGEKGDTGVAGPVGSNGSDGQPGSNSGSGSEVPAYMKAGYVVPINSSQLPLSCTFTPSASGQYYSYPITINSIAIKLKDYNSSFGAPYAYEVTINYHKNINEVFGAVGTFYTLGFSGLAITTTSPRENMNNSLALLIKNEVGDVDGTFTYTHYKNNPIIEVTDITFEYAGFSADRRDIEGYYMTSTN